MRHCASVVLVHVLQANTRALECVTMEQIHTSVMGKLENSKVTFQPDSLSIRLCQAFSTCLRKGTAEGTRVPGSEPANFRKQLMSFIPHMECESQKKRG